MRETRTWASTLTESLEISRSVRESYTRKYHSFTKTPLSQDCLESNVLDLMLAKKWAMKYATNAACTVLRVDQIIMAKRAGGPKPRDTQGQDQDDD